MAVSRAAGGSLGTRASRGTLTRKVAASTARPARHAAEGDHEAAEHRAEHVPGLAQPAQDGIRGGQVVVVDQRGRRR